MSLAIADAVSRLGRAVFAAERKIAPLEAEVESLNDQLNQLNRKKKDLMALLQEHRSRVSNLGVIQSAIDGHQVLLTPEVAESVVKLAASLNLTPILRAASYFLKLRSRYSVSKDCDYDTVGWETLDDEEPRIVINPDTEWDSDDPTNLDQIDTEFDPDKGTFDRNCVEYDGDHHGVYAFVTAKYPVTVLTITVPAASK